MKKTKEKRSVWFAQDFDARVYVWALSAKDACTQKGATERCGVVWPHEERFTKLRSDSVKRLLNNEMQIADEGGADHLVRICLPDGDSADYTQVLAYGPSFDNSIPPHCKGYR